VCRDESPAFTWIALDTRDDFSIPAAIGVNRQVTANKPNVAEA
jgi:hypothetical protein